ncbi:ROK family protein [Natranaerobius trueperi]|uniref:Glucokinase n=1 Tax=Natranaerobius trueperi TaxID=759412 RepID=A0A226BXY0_9FIRM|nr:ROK family protein [Natranaerobius trueperi]OWZ83781.1 glucokinase [Natranaerobius trueperi]
MYITFDLGGTTLKGGISNYKGEIVERTVVSTVDIHNESDLIDTINIATENLLRKINISINFIKGIGLGIPGYVPEDGERIPKIVNLGLENVFLKKHLKEVFKIPVKIENDANAAALGEFHFGAAKETKDALIITLGTGVGGGVIINERVHRGVSGLSGEIGHITVKLKSGRQCNCGKTGCLETESSGTAIEYYGKQKLNSNVTAKDVIERAKKGEEEAEKVIDNSAYYLGYALSTMFHVLEFEKVVLGGGVARGGYTLLPPVRKWLNLFMQNSTDFSEERVVLSEFGNDAALYGLYYQIINDS